MKSWSRWWPQLSRTAEAVACPCSAANLSTSRALAFARIKGGLARRTRVQGSTKPLRHVHIGEASAMRVALQGLVRGAASVAAPFC
jgi:hypothetical protein